jgi:protein phosphatase
MMVIFGGRGSDQIPLNDTWGLRKHRDGRLDWMKAPTKNNKQQAA